MLFPLRKYYKKQEVYNREALIIQGLLFIESSMSFTYFRCGVIEEDLVFKLAC